MNIEDEMKRIHEANRRRKAIATVIFYLAMLIASAISGIFTLWLAVKVVKHAWMN